MKYSTHLLHYFNHRYHAGQLDRRDPMVQYLRVGHPENDEVIDLYVSYQDNQIQQVLFQAVGSVALIAAAEFLCVWLEKKTCQQLSLLTHQFILQELQLSDFNNHIAHLLMTAVKQLQDVVSGELSAK